MHQQLRRRWARVVAAGNAYCARCGEPIGPDQPSDLGHDDYDRTRCSGVEHEWCNRAAPNQVRTSRVWWSRHVGRQPRACVGGADTQVVRRGVP